MPKVCSLDGCTRKRHGVWCKPERECSIDGCVRIARSRGWCSTHHERWRIHGDPMHQTWTHTCTVAGCSYRHRARGLCQMHWDRLRRSGDVKADVPKRRAHLPGTVCAAAGCEAPRSRLDWCGKHYARHKKHGDVAVSLCRRGAPGQPCELCGGPVLWKKQRRFCSAACSALASRAKAGEPTLMVRTDCTECGAYMPIARISNGQRRRGNGFGLCAGCSDKQPCARCGMPRKRIGGGGALRCSPCSRPRRVADAEKRRAVKVKAVCEHGTSCVTASVIKQIYSYPCFYCGAAGEHVDHFEPLARGGLHCKANLVPACATCNLTKSDHDPWEWWSRRAI